MPKCKIPKKQRRTAKEILRTHFCSECRRGYGSESSMIQHIRLKHCKPTVNQYILPISHPPYSKRLVPIIPYFKGPLFPYFNGQMLSLDTPTINSVISTNNVISTSSIIPTSIISTNSVLTISNDPTSEISTSSDPLSIISMDIINNFDKYSF